MTLIDALMCVVLLRVGISWREQAPQVRVTSNGRPACENCGRELSKVKHHRPSGIGRACAPRCKPNKRAVDDGTITEAVPTQPAAKKPRRTKSDPGKDTVLLTATRTRPHRITAPKPSPPAPKPRRVKPSVDPIDPMALLDAAHARRMALLAAESKITVEFQDSGSSTVDV